MVASGDALLLGPPGVGKTHLAVALEREAIRRGYSTLFTTATALLTALARANLEDLLDEWIAHYAKPKLLIVDELRYLPFEPTNAAHLYIQLISRRYERGAMLLPSNKAVSEWGQVFGDPVVGTANLDRLLHHTHVITIRGDKYAARRTSQRPSTVGRCGTHAQCSTLTGVSSGCRSTPRAPARRRTADHRRSLPTQAPG